EEQAVEAHAVAGLLAHLADGGVGRVLAEVQSPARQRPLRSTRARPAGQQHLLGARDHGVGGDPLVAPHRRSTKNDSMSAAHSFSNTPATTSGRWFCRRSRSTSHSDPTAPVRGSHAPNTTLATRASPIAPAHIVHGSTVTARV